MRASYFNAKEIAEKPKGRDFAQEAKGTAVCPLETPCPLPAPTPTEMLRLQIIMAATALWRLSPLAPHLITPLTASIHGAALTPTKGTDL